MLRASVCRRTSLGVSTRGVVWKVPIINIQGRAWLVLVFDELADARLIL